MAINLTAVLVAAIVYMIIGAIWYAPWLFGNEWKKLSGTEKMGNGAMSYVWAFILALITAFVLAHFIIVSQAVTVKAAAKVGVWVWLGFIATLSLGSWVWKGRSLKLWAINNAYYLITIVVMAAIIAKMK